MELPVTAPDSGGRSQKTPSYKIETKNISYKLCTTSFQTISWFRCGKKHETESRLILQDVNFEAKPGELTAIAGPSGAGKTTLLEIIAAKIPPSRITSGKVLINHRSIDPKSFQRLSGYVTQDDTLFPLLTVEETLMYSALLRLPGGRKGAAYRARQLMEDLGLDHVAGSRVGGGSDHGISGGEKRRVSIGVELVHDPSVLLIDEPTSGLDSSSALVSESLSCSIELFFSRMGSFFIVGPSASSRGSSEPWATTSRHMSTCSSSPSMSQVLWH